MELVCFAARRAVGGDDELWRAEAAVLRDAGERDLPDDVPEGSLRVDDLVARRRARGAGQGHSDVIGRRSPGRGILDERILDLVGERDGGGARHRDDAVRRQELLGIAAGGQQRDGRCPGVAQPHEDRIAGVAGGPGWAPALEERHERSRQRSRQARNPGERGFVDLVVGV
ncbi:MAG TPA: hypothetical protein VME22_16935 [Solirubrobacteraceae bacterium]|nr:hypothetical protein [Solirubrobacteraceae bacterium]